MARIALITPSFEPTLYFQEWVVAKHLSRAGHTVTVVAPDREVYPEKNAPLLAEHPNITVNRVKTAGFGITIFPVSARRIRTLCAGHDAAVINAPNHGFGYRALRVLPRTLRAAVCFGDLLDNRVNMHPLLRRWKDSWYRWLFARADRLTCNTNEAREILKEAGLGRHEDRLVLAGLPYDEELFYLEEEFAVRRPPDRIRTLITITRPMAHKPFDKWLPPVFDFLRAHPQWRYQLAGLGDDAPAQQVRRLVEESGLAERVELLPMQNQAGIRRLYGEADLGFFPRATIGIQQAMATGLPVVLPRKGTVTHLVQEGRNGSYFDEIGQASAALAGAAAQEWPDRRDLAEDSRRWSGRLYTRLIVEDLLKPAA